jgi:IclR family transcriptional regulator, acetate operon repressor
MVLHAGSAGKVFMAFDPAARRAAVSQGLTRLTPRTTVDIDLLTEQLGQIREAGYAVSFEERDLGAASLSAPVFGLNGEVSAAIGIGAPTQRMTPADVPRLAPIVVEASRRASERLGYRPGVEQVAGL